MGLRVAMGLSVAWLPATWHKENEETLEHSFSWECEHVVDMHAPSHGIMDTRLQIDVVPPRSWGPMEHTLVNSV